MTKKNFQKLSKYQNFLIEKVKSKWTEEELMSLFNFRLKRDFRLFFNHVIISDDILFDLLTMDLEDLPLYINHVDRTNDSAIQRKIVKKRLELGK